MKALRKLGIGSIVFVLAIIVGVIGLILYGVNVSSVGYFQGLTVPYVVLLGILAIAALVVAMLFRVIAPANKAGSALGILADVLSVVAAVLFVIAGLTLIGARSQGIGFVFVHDPNLDSVLSTPENFASCNTAITATVFFIVAALVTVIGNFFGPMKAKEE